ncbi:MAG: nuclear transport factor 2 family protein, partial [Acidobacteria bacterium]|nr:nuclear transport factor 2 family protein [Acidobacteriota bacterium]
MTKSGKVFVTLLLLLLACSAARAQSQQADDANAESARRAVTAYLETTKNNETAARPTPSAVVHPQSKVFSVTGNELSVRDATGKIPKRKGRVVPVESTSNIVSLDVTGSMAVAKIETVYPHGSLTAEEHKALPETDPLRASAGKPVRL